MSFTIRGNSLISLSTSNDLMASAGNIAILTSYTGNITTNTNAPIYQAAGLLPVGLTISEAIFQGTTAGYFTGSSDHIPQDYNKIQKFPFANESKIFGIGDLSQDRGYFSGGHGSNEHGYVSGGGTYSSFSGTTVCSLVDRFPFSTSSSASCVGNLCIARSYVASHSSSTNGYTSGGFAPPGPYALTIRDTLQRFTFASTVSCCNIGTLTVKRLGLTGMSSSTNGYSSAGNNGSNLALIDKFPFSTDINAICIGSLSCARNYVAGQSSSTHGYVSGGETPTFSSVIEKFPFASETCVTNGGSLLQTRSKSGGVSSINSGYTIAGVNSPSTYSNLIDRFPFSTDLTATAVSDLGFTTYFITGIND